MAAITNASAQWITLTLIIYLLFINHKTEPKFEFKNKYKSHRLIKKKPTFPGFIPLRKKKIRKEFWKIIIIEQFMN